MKRYFLIFGLLLFRPGHVLAQESPPSLIHLREHVAITNETIRLSDLLPGSASAALQKAAAFLELGRAPLPGSIRLLTQQQITVRLADENQILRQLAIPAQTLVERTGWPIRSNLILAAVGDFLGQSGWEQLGKVAGSVEWSEGMAAREGNPELQVSGVKMSPSRDILEARLRCADKSTCANFLVRIRLASGAKIPGEISRTKGRPALRSAGLLAAKNRNAGVVKRGSSAELTMESNGMRILLPVICLQGGDVGDHVLVRAEGRQVFSAQVIAAGELRAAF